MQLLEREGDLMFRHGHFEAGLRPPSYRRAAPETHASLIPWYYVRYRLVTAPANLDLMKRLEYTLQEKHGIRSHVWESARTQSCGLSVANIDDVIRLRDRTVAAAVAREHPRADVAECWSTCVNLLPTILRATRLKDGQSYTAKAFLREREAAIQDLRLAQAGCPPEPLAVDHVAF